MKGLRPLKMMHLGCLLLLEPVKFQELLTFLISGGERLSVNLSPETHWSKTALKRDNSSHKDKLIVWPIGDLLVEIEGGLGRDYVGENDTKEEFSDG